MKTIKMKRADWEKWDQALRSGEYQQCTEALTAPVANGEGFCCLGVLEMALEGAVETGEEGELPSLEWLAAHGITFEPSHDTATASLERGSSRNPFLLKLGVSAANANDDMVLQGVSVDGWDVVGHKYDFIAIADAIKDAVEFTDA
jgi:hypothetical protein